MLGATAAAIYCCMNNNYWIALLTALIFFFQIPYLTESIKRRNEIQFRINDKGIQYRDGMLESWDNIENERVTYEENIGIDKERTYYFIYYIIDSGQVMKFGIEELSIGISELEHYLKIHRGRFEREKTAKV